MWESLPDELAGGVTQGPKDIKMQPPHCRFRSLARSETHEQQPTCLWFNMELGYSILIGWFKLEADEKTHSWNRATIDFLITEFIHR